MAIASVMHQVASVSFFFFALCAAVSAIRAKPATFKKIYAFGDSFTDTGNTLVSNGSQMFTFVSKPPYGITYFHHSTNRYSDGRLVIDFVAEALSLPFMPPYRRLRGIPPQGVNFAVAGSTAIEHAFFVRNKLDLDIVPQSIGTQLSWFSKVLKDQGCDESNPSSQRCKELLKDALIWVGEIGANDYAYIVGSSVANSTVRELGLSRVTSFLKAMLSRGAKYVVVQGMPPTGCLTVSMALASVDDRDAMGCVRSQNKMLGLHNSLYHEEVKALAKQFPASTVVYLDYWNAYRTVVTKPEAYGFKETFKACCGASDSPYNFDLFVTCGAPSSSWCSNPSQYINWDGIHLTEAMHRVLATMFMKGNYSDPPFSSLLRKLAEG